MPLIRTVTLSLALLCSSLCSADDAIRADIRKTLAEMGLFDGVVDELVAKGLSKSDAKRTVDDASTKLASCLLETAEGYAQKLDLTVEDVVLSMSLTPRELKQDPRLSRLDSDRFFGMLEPCLFDFSQATGNEMPPQ